MIKRTLFFTIIIITLFFSGASLFGFGNDFTCPYGKQGACLDYGEIVCRSGSKCVSEYAICFDSNTCNFKGFVCKSELDEVIESYDSLVSKYNNLQYNYKELQYNYENLQSNFENLEHDQMQSKSNYENLKDCIDSSDNFSEAKDCSIYN